jgi:transcriptional regulator with XRE-family HTH domain
MRGLELKEIRKKLKKTQTEFGKMLGVSMRSVQNWESESRKIPLNIEILVNNILNEHKIDESKFEKSFIKTNNGDISIDNIVDAILLYPEKFEENLRFRKYIESKCDKAIIAYQKELLDEYKKKENN